MTRTHIYILVLATALLNGCGKAAVGGSGTETSTGTGTTKGDGTGSTATASSTATGNTTVTLSATATVTATETDSSTVTATVTQVNSVTRTVTATQTVSATVSTTASTTVTQTVTATATATVTATSTSSNASLVQGTYHGDDCFLDKLASDMAGQSVYMKASFHFSNGKGHKKYAQYADDACDKPVARLNLGLTYSYAGSRGGLVVFRIDQEDRSGGTQRYWLVASEKEGDLSFALDGEHGLGAFLWEPSGKELQDTAAAIDRYGIRFRHGN